MIFRSKKKHKAPKLNIAIDGKILEMVNQTNILGVLMDKNKSWKAHINHVANKVLKYFGKKYILQLYLYPPQNKVVGKTNPKVQIRI